MSSWSTGYIQRTEAADEWAVITKPLASSDDRVRTDEDHRGHCVPRTLIGGRDRGEL